MARKENIHMIIRGKNSLHTDDDVVVEFLVKDVELHVVAVVVVVDSTKVKSVEE